jgi:protoheme IX farnesyltransferase
MDTMTTTVSLPVPCPAEVKATSRSLWHDAMLLGKPRITLMVMITVAIGFLLAPGGTTNFLLMLHALGGVGLVAASSGILNQAWERDTDAKMRRTRGRPMARARISPQLGYTLGVALGVIGVVWLMVEVNTLTALLTFLTLVSYVFIYTPLKRVSAWNTFVGAIPGAMPPLLGYAAAANALAPEAWFLFGVLFLWQFPHFFAIAWMHKDDYAAAGLVMVSTIDRSQGRFTGWLTLSTALLLLALSLLPFVAGWVGVWYFLAAVLVGGLFVYAAMRFLVQPDRPRALQALWASLLYVPIVFLLFLLDSHRAGG